MSARLDPWRTALAEREADCSGDDAATEYLRRDFTCLRVRCADNEPPTEDLAITFSTM
jgi:hypothetical protein